MFQPPTTEVPEEPSEEPAPPEGDTDTGGGCHPSPKQRRLKLAAMRGFFGGFGFPEMPSLQEMRRERGLSIKTMTIAELVKWLRTLPENKKEDVLKQVLARFHHRRFRDVGATFGAKEEDPSEAARRLNAEVRQMRKDMRELTVMMVKIATVLPDGTADHYVVAPSTSDQPDPVPKEKKPLPGIASADPSGVPFEIERRASGEG